MGLDPPVKPEDDINVGAHPCVRPFVKCPFHYQGRHMGLPLQKHYRITESTAFLITPAENPLRWSMAQSLLLATLGG